MEEKWKNVEGFEGFYEVSDAGRLRNARGKILKLTVTRGYPRFNLQKQGTQRKHMVHRLVAAAFIGPRADKMTVNHKNGVKTDNRVENLEYCTQGENAKHSFDFLGRKSRAGSEHWKSKLTEDLVRQMRIDRTTMPISDVAVKYGVSIGSVSMICNRIKWKHVT